MIILLELPGPDLNGHLRLHAERNGVLFRRVQNLLDQHAVRANSALNVLAGAMPALINNAGAPFCSLPAHAIPLLF